MVDAATSSPPSKNLPICSSAIKVVASYRNEETQKYVVKPLSCNRYQTDHWRDREDSITLGGPYTSEKRSTEHEMLPKDGCDNCVEEKPGDSKQPTISSLSASKSSDTLDSIHLNNDVQKVHTNNHGASNKCVYSNLPYVQVIASDTNNYKLHSSLLSKIDAISDVEVILKEKTNSTSAAPDTACERLL